MKLAAAVMGMMVAVSGAGAAGMGAGDASLAGSWKVHTSVSGNEADSLCKFVVDGATVTGSCKSGEKENPVTGSLDGKKLTWHINIEYNGEPLSLTYNGVLDETPKIVGTVDVSPYGVTGDFQATPATATTATPDDKPAAAEKPATADKPAQ